ncbi:hypothetical protein TNCV_165281 [Trichonephila clavipes]|nr:hypothetical protein TNCV_165281 [Trichonephila clavipes]
MPADCFFHLRAPQNLHSLFIASIFISVWLKSFVILKGSFIEYPPHVFLVNIRRRCCALSATVRLQNSATLQWFLYLSETPYKSPAEDAELGTVRVSQQPVELPDIHHDLNAELGTTLVSRQLC